MKTILAAILCFFAWSAFAQVPEKRFDSPGLVKWGRYTHRLLWALFPEEKGSIEIYVSRAVNPNLEINFNGGDCPAIFVTAGFLALVETDLDYLLPLAHEVAHLKFSHKKTVRRVPIRSPRTGWPQRGIQKLIWSPPWEETYVTEHDFELMEKQELEADEFAHRVIKDLGADPCACDMLRKYAEINGLLGDDAPDDPFKKIARKRFVAMEKRCGRQ